MLRYALKRIGIALLTIFILATITFFLLKLLPGDPFLNIKVPVAIQEKQIAYYGLDKPVFQQYLIYMKNLITGNLGTSLKYVGRNVTDIIANFFPVSAMLGLTALLFAELVGMTFGILSAQYKNRWPDYVLMFFAILGIALPSMVIGPLIRYYFGVQLRILPVSGWGTPAQMLMPAFVLGLGTIASNTRVMRACMLAVTTQDYIKTAQAKGLKPTQIVLRHELKNAFVPMLAGLGPAIASVMMGSFVVEKIFVIPGLGKHFVNAVTTLDYPLIMSLTIFYGTILVSMNLLVDLLYGIVDPRIRLDQVAVMDIRKMWNNDPYALLDHTNLQAEEMVRAKTTYMKDVWRAFKMRKTALVSAIILLLLIILVLFGPMMNPYNYFSNDYTAINSAPSAQHWFGTDALGRDLWTRIWVGGRVSLLIAILATLFPFVIGMVMGGISGYFGGKVDMIMMRSIDILMGIPTMIYNILLIVVMGSGNVSTLIIAFTLTGWMGSARAARGMVLQIKAREFVMASKTLGASPARIIFRHLLPNTMGIMVVGITLTIPMIIFAEAFLSFIGLGIAPPNPSWGQLISNAAEVFKNYPYQFIIPCSFVSLTMLCFNLMGDGLRDALDPKLRA